MQLLRRGSERAFLQAEGDPLRGLEEEMQVMGPGEEFWQELSLPGTALWL